MTKVLLLSDTHSFLDEQILRYVKESDEVWHAGDIGSLHIAREISQLKPLRAVFGNIDGADIRREFPGELFFFCEQVSIYMTHIGGYPPASYKKGIKEKLLSLEPRLFICGHSHILKVLYDKGLNILHINPGAIGKYGFHKVRTMIRFQIDGAEVKNMEVIECSPR